MDFEENNKSFMVFSMLFFITERFLKTEDKKDTLASSFAILWEERPLPVCACVIYLFSYRCANVVQSDSAEKQDNVVSGSVLAAFGIKTRMENTASLI